MESERSYSPSIDRTNLGTFQTKPTPPPPDLFFVLLDLYRYGVETESICFERGILLMEISPDDVELIFRAKMLLQH